MSTASTAMGDSRLEYWLTTFEDRDLRRGKEEARKHWFDVGGGRRVRCQSNGAAGAAGLMGSGSAIQKQHNCHQQSSPN